MTAQPDALQQFLFHEAHLLDERRFEDWLKLFAPDGRYWVPTRPGQQEGSLDLSIYDEGVGGIELRLRRLAEPTAHTERPARRSCRLVSNIALEDSPRTDETLVRSKLVLHEFRLGDAGRDEHRVLAGTVLHRLRHTSEGWLIVMKRIDLICSEASLPVLTGPL